MGNNAFHIGTFWPNSSEVHLLNAHKYQPKYNALISPYC
jgi:hypothetical protein